MKSTNTADMNGSDKEMKVGLGVMVFKDGKILFCKRLSALGEGEYAFPGGKLEHMESFEAGARRETTEECGVVLKNVKFLGLFNLDMYPPTHWVGVGLTADWESGEPQVLEPEKCAEWIWRDMNDLPRPLFKATELMIEAHKNNRNFYDF